MLKHVKFQNKNFFRIFESILKIVYDVIHEFSSNTVNLLKKEKSC